LMLRTMGTILCRARPVMLQPVASPPRRSIGNTHKPKREVPQMSARRRSREIEMRVRRPFGYVDPPISSRVACE
jgi:hypothetical protein